MAQVPNKEAIHQDILDKVAISFRSSVKNIRKTNDFNVLCKEITAKIYKLYYAIISINNNRYIVSWDEHGVVAGI